MASKNISFLEALDSYLNDPNQLRLNRIIESGFLDPRIKSIVYNCSSNAGVRDEADEILQDLIILFNEKYIATIKEAQGVYSLLFAICFNLCREKKREHNKALSRTVSLDQHFGNGNDNNDADGYVANFVLENELAAATASHDEESIKQMDRESAGDELMGRLNRMMLNEKNALLSPFVQPIPEQKEAYRELKKQTKKQMPNKDVLKKLNDKKADESEDVFAKLKEIVDKTGLEQDEFANRIGILQGTLVSYLYRRTKSIPDDVMEKAANVMSEEMHNAEVFNERFGKKEMVIIVGEWMALIGYSEINKESIEKLSNILDVNEVTVKRWIKGTRPRYRADFERFDSVIQLWHVSSGVAVEA